MARGDLDVALLHGIAERQMLPANVNNVEDRIAVLNYPEPEKAKLL